MGIYFIEIHLHRCVYMTLCTLYRSARCYEKTADPTRDQTLSSRRTSGEQTLDCFRLSSASCERVPKNGQPTWGRHCRLAAPQMYRRASPRRPSAHSIGSFQCLHPLPPPLSHAAPLVYRRENRGRSSTEDERRVYAPLRGTPLTYKCRYDSTLYIRSCLP